MTSTIDTIRQFRRHLTIADCDVLDPALDEIESLLKRLRQWDVMQSTADGPYWISEINKILEDTDDPDRA